MDLIRNTVLDAKVDAKKVCWEQLAQTYLVADG